MSWSLVPDDRLLVRAAAMGLGLLVAGCASKSPPPYSQIGAPAAQTAARAPASVPVEIEDDGLPVQAAPPLRARAKAGADDPSEPFSPNYGTVRPVATDPARTVGRTVMPPPRTQSRATPVGYDSRFDPDGIIARAILEHEKRIQ